MTRFDRRRDDDDGSSGRGTANRLTFRDQDMEAAEFFFGDRRTDGRSSRGRSAPPPLPPPAPTSRRTRAAPTPAGTRVDDEPAIVETQPLPGGTGASAAAAPAGGASAPPAPQARTATLLPSNRE